MRTLMKSVLLAGQFVGLVMGSSFTIPADETLRQYPYLRLET